MSKNKLAVFIIFLILGLPSCQQKVTENTLIPTIKPTVTPEKIEIQENKVTFSQRRIVIYSKTELSSFGENVPVKYKSLDILDIIGKNGYAEKSINLTDLNYKIGSNARLIDNKLIFSEYQNSEETYFSIFNIENLQEIRIPVTKEHRELNWLENNDKFTFIDKDNDQKYLYLSDLKGDVKKLSKISTNDNYLDKSYSLSSDHKKIIFLKNDNKDISIINIDGSEQKTILHSDSRKYNFPQVSYDNKYISYYYGTDKDLPTESFIANLENLKEERIGYGSDLVWLPDENKFLFSHHDGASHFLEYTDPNNLKDKITLATDVDSFKIFPDKKDVLFYGYGSVGVINYKTLEKKEKIDSSYYPCEPQCSKDRKMTILESGEVKLLSDDISLDYNYRVILDYYDAHYKSIKASFWLE